MNEGNVDEVDGLFNNEESDVNWMEVGYMIDCDCKDDLIVIVEWSILSSCEL